MSSSSSSRRVRRAPAVLLAMFALVLGVCPSAAALVPQTPDSAMWQVNGRVRAILQTSTAIYVGGSFTSVLGPGGQSLPRTNLAAFNPTTGAPLAFAPNPNKQVFALTMAPDGSRLYVGGEFTKIAGATRRRAAAVDPVSGIAATWNPNADARVNTIEAIGPDVYLGGAFLTIGAVPRTRLAKLSSDGVLDPVWAPTADNEVDDILAMPDGSRVLVGGSFESISNSPGVSQRGLSSLHPTTGAVQPWVDHPSYRVTRLFLYGTQVFAAAGGSGGHAMAYDAATGTQQWIGFGDGDANSIAVLNGVVYIGGHFTTWQGVAASHIVALDPSTGARRTWGITMNSNLGVFTLDGFQGHLAVGGDFTRINSIARQRFARFSEPVDTAPPSAPGQPVATVASARAIDVTWPAATDNQSTTLIYSVFRNGAPAPIAQVSSTSTTTVSFHDDTAQPSTDYTYAVSASDGAQSGPLSLPSETVSTPYASPTTLTALTMLDEDLNGRVDHVAVRFSDVVTCAVPCTAPWVLTGLPAGTALQSVAVAGQDVILTLTEGWGSRTTAVNGATVALTADPSGVLDSGLGPIGFAAQAPADGMAPIPVDLTSANNGLVDNVMEPGDTFTVTFSEPIDPGSVIAANVKQLDGAETANDGMIIVGLSDGPIDLGSDLYVTAEGGTIVYQDSTLSLLDSGRKIRSTVVGACTGTACGFTGPGALAPVTFKPEPFLRDAAGNHATGTYTEVEGVF